MTTLPSTTSSTMVTTSRVVVDELELEVETLQRYKQIILHYRNARQVSTSHFNFVYYNKPPLLVEKQ